ncbi:DUF4194 domain-containing protein [Mycobacterium hubeiense]|uniref:DUF4194 domain-containing protein n=1 Tax=Mycobacterium hubeiense TaxID=1867256 RepID=UPI0013047B7D|nr:DUF4194 domain-containing protein [Mycobacterium sp. QGD 101]
MTELDDAEDVVGPQWAAPDVAEDFDGTGPRFDGDQGQLAGEVRRTLVSLLKKRYISAERNPVDWRVVMQNRRLLESRLNELFIQLVIDTDRGVAYKRHAQPDHGTQPFPTVLHDQSYSREETILLVHLRMLLRGRQPDDPAVFVDRAELMDEVANYRPADATNQVRDEKAARAAIESLTRLDLLIDSGDGERFRVAPIVEVLMSLQRLNELVTWLRTQQDSAAATVDGNDAMTEVGEDRGDGS